MNTKPINTAERTEAIRRCEKQVVELVLDHHFFASLLLSLQRSYDDSIPTMATDGVRLLIGPAFVHTLKDEEIRGVLVHEVLHVAFGHPWRRGERTPKRWNYAADYAINLQIDDYIKGGGKVALPKGGLLDQQYRDMSSEVIYSKIPDPEDPNGGGEGQPGGNPGQPGQGEPTPGMGDDLLDGAHPDGKSDEEMIADWKGKLVQAAQAARMQGSLPACMDRLVGELIAPKVPWRQVLRRFLTDTVKGDYSWMKPDRRFLALDIYIPDLDDEEAAGEFVVVVDTSGSIDDGILNEFAAEIRSIHKDLKPSKLTIIYADSKVYEPVSVFSPDDEIKMEPMGGGGTDLGCPFRWLETQQHNTKALVYLTDLEGPHYESLPTYPVLWACWSNNEEIPFGELIKVEA